MRTYLSPPGAAIRAVVGVQYFVSSFCGVGRWVGGDNDVWIDWHHSSYDEPGTHTLLSLPPSRRNPYLGSLADLNRRC